MQVRQIEVEGMDGLTSEERAEERAKLKEAGFVGGVVPKGGVDDLLDEVTKGVRGGGAGADAAAHTAEIEETLAWEKGFLEAAKQELSSRLMGDGMICTRANVSPEMGDGYTFVFVDRYGRRFDATISVDDALDLRMGLGEDWGRAFIDRVTEAAQEARRRYFARMM